VQPHELCETIDGLEADLRRREAQVNDLTTQHIDALSEIEKLKEDLAATDHLRADLEKLGEEVEAWKTQYTTAHNQAVKNNDRALEAFNERDEAHRRVDGLKQRHEQELEQMAKKATERVAEEKAKLEVQYAAYAESLSRADVADQVKELCDLRARVAVLDKEFEALKKEQAYWERQNEEYRDEAYQQECLRQDSLEDVRFEMDRIDKIVREYEDVPQPLGYWNHSAYRDGKGKPTVSLNQRLEWVLQDLKEKADGRSTSQADVRDRGTDSDGDGSSDADEVSTLGD